MTHFYASSGNVFASASEALEKYMNDFEVSSGIDLSQRSYGDWKAIPQRPPNPDDPSASLTDRIAASSNAPYMPYMIQKMVQRAIRDEETPVNTDADNSSDDDTENRRAEKGYTCPAQPVTTYHTDSSQRPESPAVDPTYASLYADLRQLKEQITNRYWSRAPPSKDRSLLSIHREACSLLAELKLINQEDDDGDATGDDPVPRSGASVLRRNLEDAAPMSLAVNIDSSAALDSSSDVANNECYSDTESAATCDISLPNADDGAPLASPHVSSHDSGMISPPPHLATAAPFSDSVLGWPHIDSSETLGDSSDLLRWRQRRYDETGASTASLASSTSRISDPKLLSVSEKEKIRWRLYELDTLPSALMSSPALR